MILFIDMLQIKECIAFSFIIIGMMALPIGNDLYQNNFSLGHMVTGDLLIILSGILYAIDITFCKYVGDKFDARRVTQIVSFICAGVAISLIVIFEIPMDVDVTQLPGILVMSILGTGMSTLFFLMALKMIGTVRTVLLYSTTAVFGVIFSGLFLAETITTIDIMSLVLVLTGIFLLRNKLAGKDDHELNSDNEIVINKSTRKISVKRGKHKSKSLAPHRVKDEIVFQGWIGAG